MCQIIFKNNFYVCFLLKRLNEIRYIYYFVLYQLWLIYTWVFPASVLYRCGGAVAPCMLVYGVPVGFDLFVTKMLDNKVKEIEANTEKAIDLLSHDKQALLTVLWSSIQHQFDYCLMLVHPSLTEAAKKVDSLMWRALENLLWYQIREKNEGLGWDFKIDVPVDFL